MKTLPRPHHACAGPWKSGESCSCNARHPLCLYLFCHGLHGRHNCYASLVRVILRISVAFKSYSMRTCKLTLRRHTCAVWLARVILQISSHQARAVFVMPGMCFCKAHKDRSANQRHTSAAWLARCGRGATHSTCRKVVQVRSKSASGNGLMRVGSLLRFQSADHLLHAVCSTAACIPQAMQPSPGQPDRWPGLLHACIFTNRNPSIVVICQPYLDPHKAIQGSMHAHAPRSCDLPACAVSGDFQKPPT
eukprot:1136313-Pelagomonas_calceolata.AAC.3